MRKLVTHQTWNVRILSVLLIVLFLVGQVSTVRAAQTLSITPITWNIIGLDSNNVMVGPNHFPVGARICNTDTTGAKTVDARFHWDDSQGIYTDSAFPDPYINLRAGTLDGSVGKLVTVTIPAAVGATPSCQDAYFEVEVTRNPAAYNHTRPYYITATDESDGTNTATTTRTRYLFVEHLVSQNRNAVTSMQLAPDVSGAPGSYASVLPGGSLTMVVGNTYWIKLVGMTSTNGYDQIESFISLPNTIFQIQHVDTTYTAETSTNMVPYTGSLYNRLYGDACVWDNDPTSPYYRSCLSVGKAGGDITVTYKVKILSSPTAPLANPEPISTLIYDFSGSSFHYNADFSTSFRYTTIIDPAQLAISKNFSPDPITTGGISALTFTITNPNSSLISNINFKDFFPSTPGAMKAASPYTPTQNTCGGTVTNSSGGSLDANSVGIWLTGGVVPANGSCSVTINVTAPTAGTYNNTYNASTNPNHLYVGTIDTGSYPSDTLTVIDGPTLTPTCGIELATWDFSTAASLAPNFQSSLVASAAATYYQTGTGDLVSTVASGVWQVASGSTVKWPETASGSYPTAGYQPYIQFSVDATHYTNVQIQFDLLTDGNWAAGSNNHIYIWSNADGGAYDGTARLDYTPVSTTTQYYQNIATASTTAAGHTIGFRLNELGAKGTGTTPYIQLDNVRITGCRVLTPSNITKSFSPASLAVGSTSTLTLSVSNPNTGPSATLSGISFNDYLPMQTLQGTVSVTNGSTAVTGTGTAFSTQLATNSIVTIPATPVNLGGTLSVTQGSPAVTGTGTAFNTDLVRGSTLVINGVNYSVADVVSATSLYLSRKYAGTSGAGLTYATYKNYTISSIASDTSLTLSSAYNSATASGVSAAAGLTVATSPTPTSSCRGTLTTATDKYGITLSGDRLQGLVSASASTTVSGTNTAFNTQLAVGSRVMINSAFYRVAAIASATSMTVDRALTVTSLPFYYYTTALSGTIAVTNNNATVTGTGTTFTTQLAINSVIYIKSVRYTVSAIASDTSLTISPKYAALTESGLAYSPESVLEGTVTTNGTTAVTGSGTRFKTELRPGETVYINNSAASYVVSSITSDTSLTLTATAAAASAVNITKEGILGLDGGGSATCTITLGVKANMAGIRTNISGLITSTQGGDNTGANGYATAALDALVPPVISKQFAPNPIQTGATSTLTFTLTNPNQSDVLPGVKFSDTFPSGVTVASPLTVTNSCPGTGGVAGTLYSSGGTLALAAGDSSIRLGSSTDTNTATIAAGGTCTISVKVTATTVLGGSLSGTAAVTQGSPEVTGTGTSFSTQLSAGRQVYISGARYFVASVTDNFHLTLSSNYMATSASGLTLYTGSLSGTLAVANGSATVTGTGTAFNTELAVGRSIYINSQRYVVASISSATSMTLTSAYTGISESGVVVPAGYYNISGSVAAIINGATTTGNTASDTLMVNPVNPAIAIHKQVSNSSDPDGVWYDSLGTLAGSNVYYKFTVENTGDVAFTSFSVNDPALGGAITCTWSPVGPGLPVGTSIVDPTAACVFGPIVATSGTHTNTATASGIYNSTTYSSTPDTATYNTKALSLVKSVTETYYTAIGNVLHYSYVVTNSGSASLAAPVTVSDDKTSVTCPAVSSVGDGDSWFDPNESMTCTATYAVLVGDIGAGKSVVNTASASADGATSSPSSQTVYYKSLDLTVSVANNTSGNTLQLGQSFTWTFTQQVSGDTSVTFASGQTILSASLPVGPTYGSVTAANFTLVTNSGNIICSIASSTLTCSASGAAVTIDGGGSFTAAFSVTPLSKGSLSTTGTIDSGGVIYENNEGNNTATNSINVVTVNAVDDNSLAVTKMWGGTPIPNVLVNDTLNGSQATTGNVDVTKVDPWPAGINLNTSTGAVSVDAGTDAGDYSAQYTICDKADGTNCDTATVHVYVRDTPTAVTVAAFNAQRMNSSSVMVKWDTTSEASTVGFNIYRQIGPNGAEVRLNANLIPVQNPGSDAGASYSFEDDTALTGSGIVVYRIECINTSLQPTETLVVIVYDHSIFLPMLRR